MKLDQILNKAISEFKEILKKQSKFLEIVLSTIPITY